MRLPRLIHFWPLRRVLAFVYLTIFAGLLLGSSVPAVASLSCQKLLVASLGKPVESRLTVDGLSSDPIFSKDLKIHIEAIRKVAQALRERHISATRVFYPAAGYDAATPVLLFPDAIEIVAVDMAPFHDSGATVIKAEEGRQSGGTFILTIDSLSGHPVAGYLVKRLSLVVPNFRLLSVTKWESLTVHGETSSNGMIEYDSGPGTQLRRYIHIQDFISSLNATWGKLLTENRFDAVIVKGLDLNDCTEISAKMKSSLYQELREKKGVLIEDYGGRGWLTGKELPEGSKREDLNTIFGHVGASIVSFK